jgi:glycine/D-amino acid oxidase-like deaminating enzyme
MNRLLARGSIDFYKHVQTEVGFNLDLEMVGYLWLLTEKQWIAYESVANQMRTEGIQLKVVERDELASLMPDLVLDPGSEQSKRMGLESVHNGLLGLNCGTMSADLIVKFYENEFKKLGGQIQFGTEAKSLHLGARNSLGLPGEPLLWQDKFFREVETNHGTISADMIVLAAGTRTPLLLDPVGIDCLIKPKKAYVFEIRGRSVERLLATNGFNEQNTIPFTILPRGEVALRPFRSERSFCIIAHAGFGGPFMLEDEPITDLAYYTRNIYPILSEYLPCFTNLRPVNSWAGFYDLNSLDLTPIIQKVSNCIMVTGMSGSGIMKADAVGRVAAGLFDDKKEATLFGNVRISTSRLGLTNREVGREGFSLA